MAKVSSTTSSDLRNAQARLRNFLKTLDTVPVEILTEEATRMQAEMKLETPVETSRLQQSVKCAVTKRRDSVNLTASASAKSLDGNYDYAKIQHDTSYYLHPRGGKYHFVKDPFDRGVLRIKSRLKKGVKY